MKYVLEYTVGKNVRGIARINIPDSNLPDEEYKNRLESFVSVVNDFNKSLERSGAQVSRRIER